MSEMEGIQSSVQVALKMADILEKLLGFSWNTGKGAMVFAGKGFGKGFRLIYEMYKNNKMLGGGERTFQEIVKNKGSLDMAITTVYLEEWNSAEGKELQGFLKNRGIQFVLLDDMTKGDNRVQFMYHASDAQRVNHLLTEYKKVGFDPAKSTSQAFDDLPKEQQVAINETFEEGLKEHGYGKEYGDSVYWNMKHGDEEKKTKAISKARDQVRGSNPLENVQKHSYTDILIPKENVKMDKSKDVVFIRSGSKGYILPLSCVEKVVAGDGELDLKYRCKIEHGGTYMELKNKTSAPISGKELQKELKQLHKAMAPYKENKKKHPEREKKEKMSKNIGKKATNMTKITVEKGRR